MDEVRAAGQQRSQEFRINNPRQDFTPEQVAEVRAAGRQWSQEFRANNERTNLTQELLSEVREADLQRQQRARARRHSDFMIGYQCNIDTFDDSSVVTVGLGEFNIE